MLGGPSGGSAPTRCAVLGRPIAHSLSPVLHRAAYRALGLDWVFEAHDLGPEDLAGYVAGLPDAWRGLSLTMPLKEVALGVAARVSDEARRARAVNTLVRDAAGRWDGSNTDIPGLVAAWREHGVTSVASAVVLGAGATARSAVCALGGLGAGTIEVLARDPSRAGELVSLGRELGIDIRVVRLGETEEKEPMPVDMLVSTVPPSAQQPLARQLASRAAAVTDVVYTPATTPLLAAAGEAGRTRIFGFDLLLHQAALQVEGMSGRSAPLEAMRTAGLAALRDRGGEW